MKSFSGIVCVTLALLTLLAAQANAQQPAQTVELKLEQAQMLRGNKFEEVKPNKDAFAPGIPAIGIHNVGPMPTQLRWPCNDIPEGEYYIEAPVSARDCLSFSESLPHHLKLYVNDTLVTWTGNSYPSKAGRPTAPFYVANMIAGPFRIAKGDVLRLTGGNISVGTIKLHKTCPTIDVQTPPLFNAIPHKAQTDWLEVAWDQTKREGNKITQSCQLFNPGVLPRTVRLVVQGRDFLQNPLLDNEETIVVPPCQPVVKTYEMTIGEGRSRLSLKATADGFSPTRNIAKFFINDVTTGPRPRASLNGDWEMYYVEGVEVGSAPPADAKWEKCVVPTSQDNKRGHCMWFRRTFDSPAHVTGERIIISFGEVLSESWTYINGKMVHHQFDGAEPFEADVTAAWKQGGKNEILVAARDWISYSPRNRERVLRGEETIKKDGMIAPSGYFASGEWGGGIGMGRPVYLEARPAISVEDVNVVTTIRDKKLSLIYKLVNKSAAKASVTVAPVINDAGKEFVRIAEQSVTVEPGASAEARFEMPWPKNARLWQPGAAHLYVLQTDLKTTAPAAADRHIQRFGFRDIYIDGIHFIVNGVRTKLRSSWVSGASGVGSSHKIADTQKCLEEIWFRQMFSLDNLDVQITRTHNHTAIREVLEIADETGLMVKPENGSFCQQGFTFDQEFWKNTVASEVRMVEVYRSHPSVFMWSAGNENMWGWLYQGEATRTMGNRWQVKVVQAMRQADPQGRPIEWEADGDLMGKWEYHQLHYPRELSRSPELPVSAWWGDLDGKTVIPYSMGPITLGEKPLTDGEAFWPRTINRPFGTTILLGDDSYTSARTGWVAWMESSQYFVNGFRDVEFALIDTYTPLSMVRPQALVLKEETSAFYGGSKITRKLNVHSDVPHQARLTLKWELTSDAGKKLDSGNVKLDMAPAELKRLDIQINLPKVKLATAATFSVELIDQDKQIVHELSRQWLIGAPPQVIAPAGLKLSLYDPQGISADMLTRMKVPFTRLASLEIPKEGTLILGKDSVKQAPQGPWREQLLAFVRSGGKVVILEQSETMDFLPFPITLAPDSNSTIAFVRAPSHPLMKGITSEQLKWWAGDHFVSRGNYRKSTGGNTLPIVDIGTMDGLLESPLLEQYLGKGSIILCQMLLSDKPDKAPIAGKLLQNMLDYLAMPAVYRQPGKTALLIGTNKALQTALLANRLAAENLTGRLTELDAAEYSLAIVDAATALDATTASALKNFASQGGNVLIHKATPENKAIIESMLGIGLTLSDVAKEHSTDVHYRVQLRGQAPATEGLSNHEFFWASKTVMTELGQEGRWNSTIKANPEEMLADYFLTLDPADAQKANQLTFPCALLAVPVGKGTVVVNQLRLDEPIDDVAPTVTRLRSLLLTNMGATFAAQEAGTLSRANRLKKYEFFPVSLAAHANRGLRDNKEAGIVGWTNQGENDMRSMPTGNQKFADVPFYIHAPKSVITLYSSSGLNRDLPKEVKDIPVNRRADTLFFLHSLAYAGTPKPFIYRVNYKDGQSLEVPITQGCQAFDWWENPTRFAENMAINGTVIGFTGENPLRKGVLVFLYEWPNPHPEKEIAGIDFARVNEEFNGVPVLVGITAATMKSDEGIVTDVTGVHGLKVQLGTQVVEVNYIGVGNLSEKHPYYEQAVAAHKAMVVGKKVIVQDDVVTTNQAGQRMAYVFLKGDYHLRDLVNARIIGDGLGKLGNFEGNNRHRMYLENLSFISSQGKKGLWSTEK